MPHTQTSLYPEHTITKSPNLAEVELNYKSKVKHADRIKVSNSKDSAHILRSIWTDRIEFVEEFAVLLLNRANQVLGWAKISVGGTAGTIVDAKIVFQLALNANASGLILCHNHPSGNLKPSQEDISLTKRLKEGGKLLDIQVLDHIILTADLHFSMADEGLMY